MHVGTGSFYGDGTGGFYGDDAAEFVFLFGSIFLSILSS